jgi:hypothetical protein
MRFLAILLVVFTLSPIAFAQSPAPPSAPAAAGSPQPGAISRADYIKQAADRAALRFDRMDVNHTGYLTREQMREYRLAHRRLRKPPVAAAPATAPAPAKPQ